MTRSRPIGTMTAVAALPHDLMFVSDSQDVKPIKEHIGETARGYDAFFIRIENGDYVEVWGIVGVIPMLSKLTSRLL